MPRCSLKFVEDGSVVARTADRYVPAAHTLTEGLLPTTCVVVNKPSALKHFPTIGLTPDCQKVVHAYREIAAVTSRSTAPVAGAGQGIGRRHEILPTGGMRCQELAALPAP